MAVNHAAVRRLNRLAERQAEQRALERALGRQVTLQQLYGSPNAETPLYNFQQYAENGHAGNAIVFSAIDRRASVLTEAVFKYRRLSDKRLFGDESLAKLETPWPDATSGDLWARMELDGSLAGNAWIRDAGDQLERLRPDWVTIVSELVPDQVGSQVRKVLGIWFDPLGADGEREGEFYPISEVAHYAPIPDPLANFRGMSWLTPVVREVMDDVRMSEYRSAYFTNAATVNLIIKYEQKLAPERVERLTNRIRERHTGPRGAFSTLVLDEGADTTVVGSNMIEAAFDALQAAGETRVLMAAGVPPIVAGARQGLQASQIGEYQQALRAFADLKMRPLWRAGCAALQKLVAVPAGAQLWYDTSDVSALQQGEKDVADTSFQQVQAIVQLVMNGFSHESAVRSVVAGDMSLLEAIPGAMSVQLQPGNPQPRSNGKTPALVGAGG